MRKVGKVRRGVREVRDRGSPSLCAVNVVLAVDIGGTKLDVATVDRDGALRARATGATVGADAEALWANLVALIDRVRAEDTVAIEAVGVGCGGPMRLGGTHVSPLNIPQWRDFPLRARLAERAGVDAFVDNDAKALALGEGWRGAAQGCRNFMAMVVSTGVGGGIILDGRLLDGALGNAGHVGHVIVEPEGRHCACGARGCLEALISGPSIQARTGRPAREAAPGVRREAGRYLGRAVGSVVNLLDLPHTVVAGSVALGFGEPFFAEAQAELDRVARLGFAVGARIEPAGLGSLGPLVGAAAVGWRGIDPGSIIA